MFKIQTRLAGNLRLKYIEPFKGKYMIRVLIVDDDVDLLEMVCLMAATHGLNPTCVSSGNAALEALKNDRFSLLLMDIFLGDHDGRHLAAELKQSDDYRDIPILLYSAGQIDSSSILDSKAEGFIQKPFNMKDLISRMRSLIH
jgi:DNA-binding response OmpR family regulator